MRQFIKDTGRVRRYDRESIGGGTAPTMPKVAQPKPATPAKPNVTMSPGTDYEPKSRAAQKLKAFNEEEQYKRHKIEMHQFEILDKPRTSEEIIKAIAGGDETDGSCTSLAFAYAGARQGADIHDFRGGNSCHYFAANPNIREIINHFGGTWELQKNDYAASHKLLKQVQDNAEYFFSTGAHTAIVRKHGDNLQYLELQSRYAENIGWHLLDDNSLDRRFDCKKRHKWANDSFIINIDQLQGDEFMYILNYINTPAGQQKKGASGGIK